MLRGVFPTNRMAFRHEDGYFPQQFTVTQRRLLCASHIQIIPADFSATRSQRDGARHALRRENEAVLSELHQFAKTLGIDPEPNTVQIAANAGTLYVADNDGKVPDAVLQISTQSVLDAARQWP
jgi:hypothetical protein